MEQNTYIAAYGTRREWRDENRIAVIVGTGRMDRVVIDEWADLVIETIQHWPLPGPIPLLIDLTAENQGFTPYAAKRTEDVYEAVPAGRVVFGAIVLPPGIINSLVSLFVRRQHSKAGRIIERVFTSHADALEWLHARLAESLSE